MGEQLAGHILCVSPLLGLSVLPWVACAWGWEKKLPDQSRPLRVGEHVERNQLGFGQALTPSTREHNSEYL